MARTGRALIGGAVIIWAAASGVTALAWSAHREMQQASRKLGTGSVAKAEPPAAATLSRDFTQDLPQRLELEALQRFALEAARSRGVALRQVLLLPQSGSDQALLPQADLQFEARGSFEALRTWQDDVLTRRPGNAWVTTDLRRADGLPSIPTRAADVDLRAHLRMFARPASNRLEQK